MDSASPSPARPAASARCSASAWSDSASDAEEATRCCERGLGGAEPDACVLARALEGPAVCPESLRSLSTGLPLRVAVHDARSGPNAWVAMSVLGFALLAMLGLAVVGILRLRERREA